MDILSTCESKKLENKNKELFGEPEKKMFTEKEEEKQIFRTLYASAAINSTPFTFSNRCKCKETLLNISKKLESKNACTDPTDPNLVNDISGYIEKYKYKLFPEIFTDIKKDISKFIDCETEETLFAWELFSRDILFYKPEFQCKFNRDCKWLDELKLENKDFVTDLLMFKYNRTNAGTEWITQLFKWIIEHPLSNLHADYIYLVRLFLVTADNRGKDEGEGEDKNKHVLEMYEIIKKGIPDTILNNNPDKLVEIIKKKFGIQDNDKSYDCKIIQYITKNPEMNIIYKYWLDKTKDEIIGKDIIEEESEESDKKESIEDHTTQKIRNFPIISNNPNQRSHLNRSTTTKRRPPGYNSGLTRGGKKNNKIIIK
jgi:hypothetical protein